MTVSPGSLGRARWEQGDEELLHSFPSFLTAKMQKLPSGGETALSVQRHLEGRQEWVAVAGGEQSLAPDVSLPDCPQGTEASAVHTS